MVAHRIAGKKLSRPTAQRIALLRSLASELIRHERIRTTEAKALRQEDSLSSLSLMVRRALFIIGVLPCRRCPTSKR
jgi:large subunit ribosomal protein L17